VGAGWVLAFSYLVKGNCFSTCLACSLSMSFVRHLVHAKSGSLEFKTLNGMKFCYQAPVVQRVDNAIHLITVVI